MRKRLLIALAGLVALGGWLARRRRREPEYALQAPEADPAEELRRRLDAARAGAAPDESETGAPTPEAPPEAAPADLDERRRSVHERGRAAIDDMRGSTSD